ncbi:hypothetical protein D3C78_1701690 [compost metagenome]
MKYGGDTLTIDDVTVANINQLVIEVKLPAIDTSKYFNVEIKGDANAVLKAIVDEAGNAYVTKKAGGQFSNVYSK